MASTAPTSPVASRASPKGSPKGAGRGVTPSAATIPAGATAIADAAIEGEQATLSTLERSQSDPHLDYLTLSPEALEKVPKAKKPSKRIPGGGWDGRVSGLSLAEYREVKWGVESGHRMTAKRSSPAYSMRALPQPGTNKRNTNFQVGDPHKASNAVKPSPPNYSMGTTGLDLHVERSQGPLAYGFKSTMDPRQHPTHSKSCLGFNFERDKTGRDEIQVRSRGTPGPGEYPLEGCVGSGSKHRPARDIRFQNSSMKSAASFTTQGREAWRAPSAPPGPGIGEYDYSKAMRTGKIDSTKWSMPGKGEPLEFPLGERRYERPGPDSYDIPTTEKSRNHDVSSSKPRSSKYRFNSEPRGIA